MISSMRIAIAVALVFVTAPVAVRAQTSAPAPAQPPPAPVKPADLFKVGMATRSFTPAEPYDWRGAETHALVTTVWYPAAAGAAEEPQWIGAPGAPLFSAGQADPQAALAASPAKFPLIVLSHGTGGSALMMGWLGAALASHGYIAAAVNHPGNNGTEAYTAMGFTVWWERARDLSIVIDQMLSDATFGASVDAKRIGAAGFSLGGYTMIEIAGGVTRPYDYTDFCKSSRADGICKSPPEFPNLVETFNAQLVKPSADFQRSLRHASDSYRDPRVRAVFAIAPALGPAFRAAELRKISIPVEIVAGAADENVPVASSAKYFAANIPGAKLTLFPAGVAHYVFLGACTSQGRAARPALCTDAPGVDRESIHTTTADMAIRFFDARLTPR